MNAVEIEQEVSKLAEQPFDAAEFPFAFLEAFGNKPATIKKLRSGTSNRSELGGVLQTNNIHIAVAPRGEVTATLRALKASPATAKAKAKFVLATDGETLEAEDLVSGETVASAYADFADKFGFFLPLAGISTVRQVGESSFDVRATFRLNRLYVELLKGNPDWAERREDMNHFMARLIFCFFAEDTDIFHGSGRFTATIEQMSARDSSDTAFVIGEVFRAMNTKWDDRPAANLRPWADAFPYVNGGLFSGSLDVPAFSRLARSYLLHIGHLDWKKINPDIFGSMIQAVAEDEERGALGMHYTSVPNILKVLNPLFLDDLREKLAAAGDNGRTLLNLRRRLARIRVFDPACGSGNFLVIAYKEMRAIEAVINQRRGEADRRSDIPLTNFRGIEIRDFPAEIARLALIIAEYQCDVLYLGQQEALLEFLPLDKTNWIVRGNALRLDWLAVCGQPKRLEQTGGDDGSAHGVGESDSAIYWEEIYLCGNPPYAGSARQTESQKEDVKALFATATSSWKSLDYVACWFLKAARYTSGTDAQFAFVATNSICQGELAAILWPIISAAGLKIRFAFSSFRWTNLASDNAGVTVVIVGLAMPKLAVSLYITNKDGTTIVQAGQNINAYLVVGPDVIVTPLFKPSAGRGTMIRGNMPTDGGNLIVGPEEARAAIKANPNIAEFIRHYVGSNELISGTSRRCIWIDDDRVDAAMRFSFISQRVEGVRLSRLQSPAASTRAFDGGAHRFLQIQGHGNMWTLAVARVSSERREYLPIDLLGSHNIISDLAYGLYDAELWNFSVVASRIHLVWIATVCGKLETRYRYSNTLGWNTFPIPLLTEKNKADLTRCAEYILLTREAHFPATIADLYDPDAMPADLREAHERNDEVLERIYIGRRFRNDTERLEKLFDLYTKMVARQDTTRGSKARASQ